MLSPIQPQLLLSLLRTGAAGLTEEEIGQTINEVNPRVISDLVSQIKYETNNNNEIGIANALFTADYLR